MKRKTTNWRYEECHGNPVMEDRDSDFSAASVVARGMPHAARFGLVAAVIGAAVVGAGASVYGSNEETSAANSANKANQQGVTAANDESWTSYLASRGLETEGNVPYGEYPTGSAINTKLPLWASVNVPTTETGPGGSSSLASAFSAPTIQPAQNGTGSTMGNSATTGTPTAPATKLPTAPGGYSPPVRSSPVAKVGV